LSALLHTIRTRSPTLSRGGCKPPAGVGGPPGDNVVASLRYADGSLCTLTYTVLGRKSKENGKERVEALWDGKAFVIDDYVRSFGAGCSAGAAGGRHSNCLARGTIDLQRRCRAVEQPDRIANLSNQTNALGGVCAGHNVCAGGDRRGISLGRTQSDQTSVTAAQAPCLTCRESGQHYFACECHFESFQKIVAILTDH
jgi:hypothetical protein